MHDPKLQADLRGILADLYPTENSARRLASQAGLDVRRIEFSTSAINIWQSILDEAGKVNQVDALLDIVLDEYSKNVDFHRLYDAFRSQKNTEAPRPETFSNRTNNGSESDAINLAGDLDKKTIIWFFAVILAFLIGLVITSIFGREIPPGSQYIVYAIIALLVSLAAGLGIGTATASGSAKQGSINYSFQIGGLVAAFLTTFLGLLAGQYFFGSSPHSTTPIPEPTPTFMAMTSPFNIAVTAFSERTESGTTQQSDEGQSLAQQFAVELRESIVWPVDYIPQFREPSDLPTVLGNNEDELVSNVATVAEQHAADLVIYGTLQVKDAQTRLNVYFYVSSRKIAFAEEVAGVYQLGNVLVHDGNFHTNPVVNNELRKMMVLRAAATARLAIGLGYFSLQRYDEAIKEFQAALQQVEIDAQTSDAGVLLQEDKACEINNTTESEQVVDQANTKDSLAVVLHLFLGSSYGQLQNWSAASREYRAILQLDDRFARAQLGAAQVVFLEARNTCRPSDANIDGIEHAIGCYSRALTMNHQPLAEIPLKVDLFQGKAYVCLSEATKMPEYLLEAKVRLQNVVDVYTDTENERIRYLGGQAAAALGLLHWLQFEDTNDRAELEEATTYFENSVDWSRELDVQASSTISLAFIYMQEDRCEKARKELDTTAGLLMDIRSDNPNTDLSELEAYLAAAELEWEKTCD